MKIRSATKIDVPQIVKLIGDVWAEYDCVLNTGAEETYLLTPDDYFRSRGGDFWVAEENGRIIATVAMMMIFAGVAELRSLYVLKDFRRDGLGWTLTRMVMDLSKEKGAAEMVLWSDTRFTNAHRLYERIGFECIGQRELDDLNRSVENGFRMTL